MLEKADIENRQGRLDALARGLAKEIAIWRKGDDPLLYLERKAYLNGLGDALAGVDTARVCMAKAMIRLNEQAAA